MEGKTRYSTQHIESSIFQNNQNLKTFDTSPNTAIVGTSSTKTSEQSLAEAGFFGLRHEVFLSATNSYMCNATAASELALRSDRQGRDHPLTDRSAPAGCPRARCPCGSPHPTTWSPTPAKTKIPPQQEQARTYIARILRQTGGRVRRNQQA